VNLAPDFTASDVENRNAVCKEYAVIKIVEFLSLDLLDIAIER